MTALHRVLVVEDHRPFRRILCQLLRERPDVLIVGEAGNGLEGIRQAEALRPDVVVLDIGLPTVNGIEAAGRIRSLVPDARLMFVTIESSLDIVDQAFRRRYHGYVYKPRAQRDAPSPCLMRSFEAAGSSAAVSSASRRETPSHPIVTMSCSVRATRSSSRRTARVIAGALDEEKAVHLRGDQRSQQGARTLFAGGARGSCPRDPAEAVRAAEHQ